jgi:hypothetical protein
MNTNSALAVALLLTAALLPTAASCQTAADTPAETPAREAPKAEKPKTYMIVSAVGEQFTVLSRPTDAELGTRIVPNYLRTVYKVKDNVLNRYVLNCMDKAIAKVDPSSKRLFTSLRAAEMDAVNLGEREQVAIDQVVADLKRMPRDEWDRIIVVTPVYRAFAYKGVDGRLAGFGVFYQPNAIIDSFAMMRGVNGTSGAATGGGMQSQGGGERYFDGEEAITPEDKQIRASKYAAPFSMIEIWVLDPKTLAVLERQQRFDNIKVFDPQSDSIGIVGNVSATVLLDKFNALVDRSITEAVEHSNLLDKVPQVDVGTPKEVKAEDVKN